MPVVAVDFGYSETPIQELGADRLIGHFDDLAAAVMEPRPRRPAKATLSLHLLYRAHIRGGVLYPASTPAIAASGRVAKGLSAHPPVSPCVV